VNNAPPDSLSHSGRGTYALIFRLDSQSNLLIGKLGRFDFRPGCYVYVGSAMGSGGLGSRLRHHLQPALRPHWHIDYLRRAARLDTVWALECAIRREHDWAALFLTMPGAVMAAPGFGASDCQCAAHLFYFTDAPPVNDFRIRVARSFPDDNPIQQYQIAEAGW
jgi:Uri superfamily endonuclease